MDLHRINLNLLVVLDTVLDVKNVTQAAKKLFITQSAISNNLQQLRDIFNDELLIREKNHMVLTDFAKELQPRLNQVLEDLNNIIQSKEFDPKTSNKRFRIGMEDYMATLILPPLICMLQNEAPNIQIEVCPTSTSDHEDLFEFDLSLMGTGYGPPLPSVMQKKLLFTDTGVCVMSCHHPLAKAKEITEEDYLRYKHIGMRSYSKFPSDPVPLHFIKVDLGHLSSQRQMQVNVPFIPAFFNTLKKSTMLIGNTMKNITLSTEIYGIVVKESPNKRVRRFETHIVWHKRYENDIANQWLRNKISEIGQKVQKALDTNTPLYK